MVHWVLGAAIMSLFVFSLFGEEAQAQVEEKRETASVEKKTGAESEKNDPRQNMKRRWTKKTKPGTPKARKVSPGRNRTHSASDGMIGLDDEEFEEEDLPGDEGKSG